MLTGQWVQGAGPDFAEDLREAGPSEGLVELLGKCVAYKPERRPQDATKLAERLARLAEAVVSSVSQVGAIAGARATASPAAAKPAVVTPRQSPEQPVEWQINVPGQWYSRPADQPGADWKAVSNLPARVTVKPGKVYRLRVSTEATDRDLQGLEHLRSLTGLQTLDLSGCERITDAGLASLRQALPQCRISS